MRPALFLSLVVLAGCSKSSTPHPGTAAPAASTPAARPVAQAAPPPAAQAIRVNAEQAACAEKWLAGHGVDDYGKPQGTMYAGGHPHLDEKTGATPARSRLVAPQPPPALP